MSKLLVDATNTTWPLRFAYVNWHEERHVYDVIPESIECGAYTETGVDKAGLKKNWVLHAEVVMRDGVERPGRRTFMLSKIEEIS